MHAKVVGADSPWPLGVFQRPLLSRFLRHPRATVQQAVFSMIETFKTYLRKGKKTDLRPMLEIRLSQLPRFRFLAEKDAFLSFKTGRLPYTKIKPLGGTKIKYN